jgi:hypothetical protein
MTTLGLEFGNFAELALQLLDDPASSESWEGLAEAVNSQYLLPPSRKKAIPDEIYALTPALVEAVQRSPDSPDIRFFHIVNSIEAARRVRLNPAVPEHVRSSYGKAWRTIRDLAAAAAARIEDQHDEDADVQNQDNDASEYLAVLETSSALAEGEVDRALRMLGPQAFFEFQREATDRPGDLGQMPSMDSSDNESGTVSGDKSVEAELARIASRMLDRDRVSLKDVAENLHEAHQIVSKMSDGKPELRFFAEFLLLVKDCVTNAQAHIYDSQAQIYETLEMLEEAVWSVDSAMERCGDPEE